MSAKQHNSNEMTMGELANYVAANLPHDWEVVVRISAGCGVVSLFDPQGCEVELCPDDTLDEQVKQAVSYACEHDNSEIT